MSQTTTQVNEREAVLETLSESDLADKLLQAVVRFVRFLRVRSNAVEVFVG